MFSLKFSCAVLGSDKSASVSVLIVRSTVLASDLPALMVAAVIRPSIAIDAARLNFSAVNFDLTFSMRL